MLFAAITAGLVDALVEEGVVARARAPVLTAALRGAAAVGGDDAADRQLAILDLETGMGIVEVHVWQGKGSGGRNYTDATTVVFTNQDGCDGDGAAAHVELSSAGSIMSVTMDSHGHDYTKNPSIVFHDPGGGKGARASARRAGCKGWLGLTPDPGGDGRSPGSCLLDAFSALTAHIGLEVVLEDMFLGSQGQNLHPRDGKDGVAFANLKPYCDLKGIGYHHTQFKPYTSLKTAIQKPGHFVIALVLSEGKTLKSEMHCIGLVVRAATKTAGPSAILFDFDAGMNGVPPPL